MKQYMLAIHQPVGPAPSEADLAGIMSEVDAVNQELADAGAWVFGAGLHDPDTYTVLRPGDGEVLTTDGPYVGAKEFLGGFTVIKAPDLDAALVWGRKLAAAITLPIEVRPLHDETEGCRPE